MTPLRWWLADRFMQRAEYRRTQRLDFQRLAVVYAYGPDADARNINLELRNHAVETPSSEPEHAGRPNLRRWQSAVGGRRLFRETCNNTSFHAILPV